MTRPSRLRSLLHGSMLFVACASIAPAAQAAKPLLTFKVDDTVTARVEHADGDHVTVRFLPSGKTQTLDVTAADEEGRYHLASDDYNFDGHRDLAMHATLGMVNDGYGIYLYDTARQRFEPLRMPASDMPHGNCDGLVNVQAKPKERTLYSSCRGGPIWYTDAYRFDGSGRMYLYQSSEAIPDDLRDLLDTDNGPSSMLLTYDAQGKRVARRPDAYGGGTVTFKVRPARLPLHDAMTDAPTRRYVVAGDTVEVIDASADFQWLKVRYRNPHAGAVQGWVSAKEAMGN
ncbi:SH3 domain-containing protein [Burkholderia cepacia]|uniref:SH3 domain-containing protein n=1 Tax=Burkholderia cepacia TaxID=292 RepID=UPI00157AA3CA|nr:SH3 domain-containing protein [Burkholderia cepacia]NTX47096.1 SH3 domain-containing protein [Burkholderia cepacia]